MLTPTLVEGLLHAAAASPAPAGTGLWPLFLQSFDLFTILLLIGSFTGVTLIFLCLFEVREKAIIPAALASKAVDHAKAGRWESLAGETENDASMLARTLNAAAVRRGQPRAAIREAADLVASEESARWFRKIDMLNVIGNLGPLVGLAGTVWGMILAFTSLGERAGQAGPADLSLGISKALFHTLLGLCLAIPCLFFYSYFRNRIDRLCTRALVLAGEIVEKIPACDDSTAGTNKA